MSADLRQLADRAELVDLLHDYCRFIDLGDTAAAAALFTQEAVFVSSTGRNGTTTGREAIEQRLALLISTFAATSHHLSNTRIEFDGVDHARLESYLHAWHRFTTDRPDGILWARYVDVAVRTDDGWKLRERTLQVVGEQDFAFGWVPYRRNA